jgi:hypothetical protein
VVGLCALLRPSVIARFRGISGGPASGVLIAMAGVLHQLSLGLLKPLGLPLAGLGQGPLRLAGPTIGRGRL